MSPSAPLLEKHVAHLRTRRRDIDCPFPNYTMQMRWIRHESNSCSISRNFLLAPFSAQCETGLHAKKRPRRHHWASRAQGLRNRYASFTAHTETCATGAPPTKRKQRDGLPRRAPPSRTDDETGGPPRKLTRLARHFPTDETTWKHAGPDMPRRAASSHRPAPGRSPQAPPNSCPNRASAPADPSYS